MSTPHPLSNRLRHPRGLARWFAGPELEAAAAALDAELAARRQAEQQAVAEHVRQAEDSAARLAELESRHALQRHDLESQRQAERRTLEARLAGIGAKRTILTHMSAELLARLGDVACETAEDGKSVEF